MFEDIKKMTCEHYEETLAKFGDTPQGMDWKDADSQKLRFKILTEIDDLNGKSIHDFGCGAGHLVDYLEKKKIECQYLGTDISQKMIDKAKKRHNKKFVVYDLLTEGFKQYLEADYIITSGIFNVKNNIADTKWKSYIETMLVQLFCLAKKGLTFNMLSSYVDYRDDNLFYLSPESIFSYCIENLSRKVTLKHDYPLWEYTVYVYK